MLGQKQQIKMKTFFLKSKNFTEFALEVVESRGKRTTQQRRISNLKKIIELIHILRLSEITREKIAELNHKLTSKYRQSYVDSVISTLSVVTKEAVKLGYFKKDPFDTLTLFRNKDEYKYKYIENKSLHRIENCKIDNDVLDFARDMFVFQCHTGLAYSDLNTLATDEIITTGNEKWIFGKRNKTGVIYTILLDKKALRIIEKYKTKSVCRLHRLTTHNVFHHINLAYYNLLLKVVGKAAGIPDILTSHRARHTFATLLLEKGVSIETISKELGHTNTNISFLYSKVTTNKIKKELLEAGIEI